jgi:hypothetical protein
MAEMRISLDDELYKKFIEGIPRSMTIRNYVVDLIKKEIDKREEMKKYGGN